MHDSGEEVERWEMIKWVLHLRISILDSPEWTVTSREAAKQHLSIQPNAVYKSHMVANPHFRCSQPIIQIRSKWEIKDVLLQQVQCFQWQGQVCYVASSPPSNDLNSPLSRLVTSLLKIHQAELHWGTASPKAENFKALECGRREAMDLSHKHAYKPQELRSTKPLYRVICPHGILLKHLVYYVEVMYC